MITLNLEITEEQENAFKFAADSENIKLIDMIHDIVVFYCEKKYNQAVNQRIAETFKDLSPEEKIAKLDILEKP